MRLTLASRQCHIGPCVLYVPNPATHRELSGHHRKPRHPALELHGKGQWRSGYARTHPMGDARVCQNTSSDTLLPLQQHLVTNTKGKHYRQIMRRRLLARKR